MTGVDRDTILWSIVAFFGATVAFQAIQDALADEGALVTIAAEVAALAAIVALIVVIVRWRGRRDRDR